MKRVEADPQVFDTLVWEFLEDPRLEDSLVSLFADQWWTRVDDFQFQALELGISEEEEHAFDRAVGEEPLRLAAHIVVDDQPWTEIVTANTTRVNEVLAELYPVTGHDGSPGWQTVQWTDSRPAVGALATNGLWLRYFTTESNQNRNRVAALSRLFLCVDFLERPVSFNDAPALADAESTEDALSSEPYCIGCHATVDPIAATLFGFWTIISHNAVEATWYHAERELSGASRMGVEPAYFGQPISGLAELGQAIAADPRFPDCAVDNFASGLWRRDVDPIDDFDVLEQLRRKLLAEEMRIKPLLRAIVDTETYQAGGGGTSTDSTRRMLTPAQLASVVEDLTGFRWEWKGFDQLDSDQYGYRVLAGGVDGTTVYRNQDDPGMTWALVVERLAQAAAEVAVDDGLLGDLGHVPGDAALTAALETLHFRLMGRRLTADESEEVLVLWQVVYAKYGASIAWKAVISAWLRDPEFVSY
jgi:hypothetical protein